MIRTITFDDSIYKLVPLEPTDEMALEGLKASLDDQRINGLPQYKAMIAAAPEYQDTKKDE